MDEVTATCQPEHEKVPVHDTGPYSMIRKRLIKFGQAIYPALRVIWPVCPVQELYLSVEVMQSSK